MPLAEFQERMRQMIEQLHDCPRLPGVDKIYVAGEIEWAMQRRRLREGVPLEESVLTDLERLEGELSR
ncbi:MAG TPA: Ldh family oxidoreductase [Actinomycetes bacterium]